MTRSTKIKAIATFELFAAVKRPGYLIATFGMPLFMAVYGAIVAIPAYYVTKQELETAVYGVVDRSGVVTLQGDVEPTMARLPAPLRQALEASGQGPAIASALADDHFVFRPFADEAVARQALAARTIKGYFVLPANYLAEGIIESYRPDSVSLSGSDARRALGNVIRERLVAGRVEGRVAARILDPVQDTHLFAITRTGEVRDGGRVASAVRLFVPLAFMLLFLMSILMTSGYLIQGTVAEKENKVVEVLLASASADEILTGKLIGLGGAGLLQITIWLSMLMVGGMGIAPLLIASRVQLSAVTLALGVPLFLLGFLFFGSLMLGTGSLGSNMRESQQFAMVWSLTAAMPLILMSVLIREPHGVVARVLTWLPITAAPMVILRSSLDPASLGWWEIGGAILVLAFSAWMAIRIAARLFRIGLLSAGSRPSLREIFRQARLGT